MLFYNHSNRIQVKLDNVTNVNYFYDWETFALRNNSFRRRGCRLQVESLVDPGSVDHFREASYVDEIFNAGKVVAEGFDGLECQWILLQFKGNFK
jgi:hypothetical protein